MKLVPYAIFGQLRLAKWCPDDKFLEDQDSWYQLICERIRGVEFLRSMEHPDDTFKIELDLFDFSLDLRQVILEVVGLPVTAGCSPERLKELFGEPRVFKRFRRRHNSWYEYISDGPEPYEIICVFQDDKGLSSLSVQRLDIPFPKAQDELDSSPGDHRDLDDFEVLPENIKSPESPVSKAKLLMESTNRFRFLIHVRPQPGVVLQAATLTIRNPAGEENTRIDLPLSRRNEDGVIELSGHIDRDLLFRSFVRLSMSDETHHTSQYVFIEFDQFYGIAG
jgi:hypothetical protein